MWLTSLIAMISTLAKDFFLHRKMGSPSSGAHVSLEDDQAYARVCDMIDGELGGAQDLAARLKQMLPSDQPIADLTVEEGFQAINTLYSILEHRDCKSYQRKNMVKSLIAHISLKSELLPSDLSLTDAELREEHQNDGGGNGDIFKGQYLEKQVAMKSLRCFNDHYSSPQQRMKKLAHEVIVWSKLHHKHIVPLFGITSLPSHPGRIMISPWMENGQIIGYLARNVSKENYKRESNRLLYQVSKAIRFLRDEGTVHGDIRGANVLIDGKRNAFLTDFGSATLVGVRNIQESGTRAGSRACRAPELFMKPGEPTFACDIYAFGMLCVEVYLGHSPYQDKKPEHISIEAAKGWASLHPRPPTGPGGPMSKELWPFVKSCLKGKPSRRPSAHVVVARMEGFHLEGLNDPEPINPAADDQAVDRCPMVIAPRIDHAQV